MKVKAPRTHWNVVARSKEGEFLWEEEFDNMVFDAGINHFLETFFKGTGYPSAWYIGLVDALPAFAANDTAGSHPGWAENVNYSEASRPVANFGEVSSKSISNANQQAMFTISALTTTLAGVFLSTSSVKGGTDGIIYAAALFASGAKTLALDAVLTVTVTATGV